MEPKFHIGQWFKTRGKHSRVCVITDILKTYNSKNELVRFRYTAQHEFMGQIVTDHDVCETTVAMGAIKPAKLGSVEDNPFLRPDRDITKWCA